MSDPTPKEIRDAYQDFRNGWQDIRNEAQEDMRAISVQGPWSNEDRDARKGSGRPCIHLDQLNQFLAQINGNARKSKRAIKAIPKGNGANDQDAKKRSAAIMGIEERSQAQPIYLGAFQSQIERSYGFSVLRTEYKDDSSFDQEILIKPIMNPDTVLLTPYYKQPDASDITEGFILDLITKKQFKEKYPKAKVTDFGDEDLNDSTITDWIKDKYVQRAEFWKIQSALKKLLLIETDKGPIVFTEDEWKVAKEKGATGLVKRERTVEIPSVFQYMTNGVEILDKIPWDGSRIPIISCLGPERWTTEGGTAKRQLLSMVRFARDPQMLLDYFASGECEEAGMVPKAPFVGAVGQFETDRETWDEITKVPHSTAQYDLVLDAGGAVAPPPARPSWVPNFEIWEVAKEAAIRAIQAGMGIAPLPDAAQRRNQKSGVALEKIDDMISLGAFPFIDRFENGYLYNAGWQINELITPVLDTQREMPIAQPDGKRGTMQLVGNTSHPLDDDGAYNVQGLDQGHLHTGKGEFGVTLTTGPSQDSERQEQDEFVDSMIENLETIASLQPGSLGAKVIAKGIRMRPTLGPVGQQIADDFDPPPADPNMPPQAQAAIQQLQSQLQQATQENAGLHMERAGKVLEQQTKMLIQQMKEDGDNQRAQLANDIKVLLAEIGAKSQSETERNQMYYEFWKENHSAAHDVGLQAMEHQHDAQQAQQMATLQQQTQASDQLHQQTMAAQPQPAAGQ